MALFIIWIYHFFPICILHHSSILLLLCSDSESVLIVLIFFYFYLQICFVMLWNNNIYVYFRASHCRLLIITIKQGSLFNLYWGVWVCVYLVKYTKLFFFFTFYLFSRFYSVCACVWLLCKYIEWMIVCLRLRRCATLHPLFMKKY